MSPAEGYSRCIIFKMEIPESSKTMENVLVIAARVRRMTMRIVNMERVGNNNQAKTSLLLESSSYLAGVTTDKLM